MADAAPIINLADIEPVSQTVAAIYAAYERKSEQWESSALGASAFSTDCDRSLWYSLHWCSEPEQLDGRKLRLFATGNREEDRIVADLRAAGITVKAVDPSTGRQWAVEALGGHLRGKLDGIATNVPEAPKTAHVFEAKTHNAKSFAALLRHGVKTSKPGHYRQTQIYMHLMGITRALYVAVCKNDDSIYVERIEYDLIAASQLMARAERVISADSPPPKQFEDPNSKAAFACSWCNHRKICHEKAFSRVTCRSCLHATAVEGGWHCAHHDMMLDKATQKAGCANHLFIPSLVPGKLVDADEDLGQVTYSMPDGSTWIDGAVS